jgi:rhamnulose-1-phosphate aldolase
MTERVPGELGAAFRALGEAGRRLAVLHAATGAAGNLSICLRSRVALARVLPVELAFDLDAPIPSLEGATVLVTGSGCRLGEVAGAPEEMVGAVVVGRGGAVARLHVAQRRRFERLTVEFATHLAIHAEHLAPERHALHAVVHAQPPNLTYLTHVPECRGTEAYSRTVLRWHPELVYHLREGIGYVPFHVPGTRALTGPTLAAMRRQLLVVWEKHGVISRSGESIAQACDWIEYAESGAAFARWNLANGGRAEGLTDEEIARICRETGITCSLLESRQG